MEFIYILVIIITIILFVSRNNTPKKKITRNRGEREVNRVLERIAKKVGGMEFIDIMLEDGEHTAQIDNILLTRKALYVIEMKDYSGWIFGSENNTNWTQVFTHYKAKTSGNNYKMSGVSKYQFYNPIKQNRAHINIINKLTNVNKLIPIYNIVVFGSRATLKDIKHKTNSYVISIYELTYQINNIESSLSKELTPLEQEKIVDAILFLNIDDHEKRKEHIRRIKSRY